MPGATVAFGVTPMPRAGDAEMVLIASQLDTQIGEMSTQWDVTPTTTSIEPVFTRVKPRNSTDLRRSYLLVTKHQSFE